MFSSYWNTYTRNVENFHERDALAAYSARPQRTISCGSTPRNSSPGSTYQNKMIRPASFQYKHVTKIWYRLSRIPLDD